MWAISSNMYTETFGSEKSLNNLTPFSRQTEKRGRQIEAPRCVPFKGVEQDVRIRNNVQLLLIYATSFFVLRSMPQKSS